MELLSNEIAGNRDAKQMLVSAQRWRNEPVMAAQIWNAIFDFVKNSELRNDQTSIFLEECILTFNKYYRDEHAKLPLILSANMFYLGLVEFFQFISTDLREISKFSFSSLHCHF